MCFAMARADNENSLQKYCRVIGCVASMWSKTVGVAFLRWECYRAVPTGDSEEGERSDA
jgi:hypothetical protein